MRKLNLRRLFGMVGVAAMMSLVFFTAFGASVDCTGQTECSGTEFSDVIADSSDTETLFGLGGDDTITLASAAGSDPDEAFAGPGDDRITVTNAAASESVFGEDGHDFFNVTGDASHTLNGGRGDDTFLLDAAAAMDILDGPGADTIRNTADDTLASHTITLVNDNQQDTVLGDDSAAETIFLGKGSGRDVIDCGDGGGTLFLKGNRKAVDTFGNNLRKAALLGGTAQSNCDTIIP